MDIDDVVAQHTEQLREHERMLNEQGASQRELSLTQQHLAQQLTVLTNAIAPISKFFVQIEGGGKLLKWTGIFLAGLIGTIVGVFEAVQYLSRMIKGAP